jgi:hypothetical protein
MTQKGSAMRSRSARRALPFLCDGLFYRRLFDHEGP